MRILIGVCRFFLQHAKNLSSGFENILEISKNVCRIICDNGQKYIKKRERSDDLSLKKL